MGSKLSDIGIQRQRKLNGSLFPIFERTRDCLPMQILKKCCLEFLPEHIMEEDTCDALGVNLVNSPSHNETVY